MKRFGQIIKVKPELEAKYKEYHANPWPGVIKMIRDCNIRNYSIFLRDGYLFAYYEYIGDDYEADMAKMAADKTTQEWWAAVMPCQHPIETAAANEWWVDMEPVFFFDK